MILTWFLIAALQQSISGSVNVVMNATDADSGIATVQCYLDGVPLGPQFITPTTPPSTYAFPWNTAQYANGLHTLTAKATDKAGNIGTTQLQVTVSNQPADITPPMIQFVTPIANSTVSGKINVQANATDDTAVTGMTLAIAGQPKVATNNGSLLYNWNTNPYKKKTVELAVTAKDPFGNTATQTIHVNVQ